MLLVLSQSQMNPAVRGTKGYLGAEWFRNKSVTAKADVYSFGYCYWRSYAAEGGLAWKLARQKEQF